MDENEESTEMESKSVPKNLDSDTTLKTLIDDEQDPQVSKKSTEEAVTELENEINSFNSNGFGTDKTLPDDDNQSKSSEPHESDGKLKTLNTNLNEIVAELEGGSNKCIEIVEEENTECNSVKDSKNVIDSNTNVNSNNDEGEIINLPDDFSSKEKTSEPDLNDNSVNANYKVNSEKSKSAENEGEPQEFKDENMEVDHLKSEDSLLNIDSSLEEEKFEEKKSDGADDVSYVEKELENKTVNVSELNSSNDEENIAKSDIDGNEVMDTEIVNCNEIEQLDLSENESQKDKEVDRISTESGDAEVKSENKEEEEVISDALESAEKSVNDAGENHKDLTSVEEETLNQPGNSEEETITGDPGSQASGAMSKIEVCIIPDDMNLRPSVAQHSKSLEVEKSLGAQGKRKVREKKNEDHKNRPIRNAAKAAGTRIKSLVETDLICEEQLPFFELEESKNPVQENTEKSSKMCAHCREVKVCKFIVVQEDTSHYLCSTQCSSAFKSPAPEVDVTELESPPGEFVRKCAQCRSHLIPDEKCLFWETMDFCNEECLEKYQTELGKSCANCKGNVAPSSLGKYCVRFGYDVKQFCSASCLEEYKKGLKVCSYCQKDISTGSEGFLAPVGERGQFKDFCTQSCMEKYERRSSNVSPPEVIEECAVCSNSKPVRVEVELDNKTHKLCSEPCFAAFKFVNNITEGQCDMCKKYFDKTKIGNFSLFYEDDFHSFCCKTCMNVYILANRKIVPCNWCKVKKYNFDMIKKVRANGQLTMMCSLNCLMLYQASVNLVCSRRTKCDFCLSTNLAKYHLTMSDATVRSFCTYSCAISFKNRYSKQAIDINIIKNTERLASPIPMGGPKVVIPRRTQVETSCVPVISSVQSLATSNGPASPSGRVAISRADVNAVAQVTQPLTVPTTVTPVPAPSPQIYQQIITKPAPVKQMKNKSILCKPYSHTKGVSCRPHPCIKETQTDQSLNRKFLIPIPVPIYVPAPMHMFSAPFPVPVPFPLPVPVPIFIPTTRNSAKGIFKEIKKIQEKIPTDPFEAELLMMAEMVAGEKKQDPTDSESEDGNDGDDGGDGTFSPENVDTSNTFGDDMLQMALKMASELEEPAVDMESVLTSNTITTTTQPPVDPNKGLYASDPDDPDQVHTMSMNRGRKRSARGSRNSAGGTPSKRGRRTSSSVDVPLLPPPEPVPPPRIEVEKPDANMCLKYTFGVNAWRHWVMQKNAELEKAAMTNRKIKLFKPELLQLTADELNFSLCLFVKEVRKPNGTEYAPDTIYYLCLGIQQYLFENGRIDNIFTDSYYEKFTDCLDEVAKKFAALYNDSQYIVTRVEEEHLWESKQLGAHSPHVLLSTLMFFNTKHFNLVTVEEHMQLSFSHIMKHWKRNPNTPGVAKVPGSRNVLLRFYPPQSALEANSRKKKVYEQQENEENPLRCPVKLYEFYLSKCPESVKTRNDVFYLLPERSCVPDSPVWYSTMALGKEPLMKMLHRVKMVKEINIALLTS